jgi:hypothetical protein
VDYGATKWLEQVPRWDQLSGEPEDRLRRMLIATARSLADRPAFLRILILLPLERQDMDPDSLAVIRTVRRRAAGGFRRAFREIFVTDGDPEADAFCDDVARFALSLTDGAFVAYEIDRDRTQLDRSFDFLVTAFLALGDRYLASRTAAERPGRS